MATVTYVTPDCAGLLGFGVTLNIFGSDIDPSRMVILDSLGNRVSFRIITSSPIFLEVAMTSGNPGFVNGNYFIGFFPYETEAFPATIVCPLPDVSGLLIVNPDVTRRDAYIRTETKIPDPTIRTALLGE